MRRPLPFPSSAEIGCLDRSPPEDGGRVARSFGRGFVVILIATALGLAAPPARAERLLALVDTGELFQSVDQGVSWSMVSTLPVPDAIALAAGSSSSDLYLASRSGVVYRSEDAGGSWNPVGTVSAVDVVDLMVRPDLTVLVLTATGSLFLSLDRGASFDAIAALPGPDFVSLTLARPANRLYAFARTGSVFESSDGGTSWAATGALSLSDGLELRAAETGLYALSASGDVYRSTDQGMGWSAVGTLSQSGMSSLIADGSTLVAATGAGEVATSADGAHWSWRGSIDQLFVNALASDVPATTGVSSPASSTLELSSCWPNPRRAGEALRLRITLTEAKLLEFVLFDVHGRRVWARGAEYFHAGAHVVSMLPSVPGAGLHFLRVQASPRGAGPSVMRRVTLLR